MAQNIILTVLRDPLQANVTWSPVMGTFEIHQYHVKLCINGNSALCSNMMTTSTTETSMNFNVTLFDGDTIFAEVVAESQCGVAGNTGTSNMIIYEPESPPSCKCVLKYFLVFIVLLFSF